MSTLSDFLTGIANAIRGKTGETGTISASLFAEKIAAIESGIDTSDADATASDINNGKTAYVDGEKITGTHTCPTLASMTSDATAERSDVARGKIFYAKGSKAVGTHTCPTLASMTSDATATASDINSGKTAYVNGEKITGTNSGFDLENVSVRVSNSRSSSCYFRYSEPGSAFVTTSLVGSSSNISIRADLTSSFGASSDGSTEDLPVRIVFTGSGMLLITIL